MKGIMKIVKERKSYKWIIYVSVKITETSYYLNPCFNGIFAKL